MAKFIDVKERLPEYDESVIITYQVIPNHDYGEEWSDPRTSIGYMYSTDSRGRTGQLNLRIVTVGYMC